MKHPLDGQKVYVEGLGFCVVIGVNGDQTKVCVRPWKGKTRWVSIDTVERVG